MSRKDTKNTKNRTIPALTAAYILANHREQTYEQISKHLNISENTAKRYTTILRGQGHDLPERPRKKYKQYKNKGTSRKAQRYTPPQKVKGKPVYKTLERNPDDYIWVRTDKKTWKQVRKQAA